LRFIEILADDREPSNMPRIDGPLTMAMSEPPTKANIKNSFRDLLLKRS
jgi:hypothetical protein